MSDWTPPSPETENPSNTQPWLYFSAGLAIGVGLHVAMGVAMLGLTMLANNLSDGTPQSVAGFGGTIWMIWLMTISLAQLFYLGPVWLLTRKWRPPMAQGILVVGAITFLLQGSCYGFFLFLAAVG